MKQSLKRIARGLFAAVLLAGATGAQAAWPEKPITLVVPFAPGGNTDALGRILAQHLTSALGQPVIVENKPGAGSMIGSQAVARANPDGYTLLVGSISNVLNHYFYKKPLYDITKDLVPVSQLVSVPNYLAVNSSSSVQSVKDIIELAKAKGEEISCATTGVGTSPYLSCEMFKALAGVKILNVPHKGGAPALTAVLGGHATMVFSNEALPYIKDKRLKGIAVTTPQRSPLAPDLPALSETVPGFDVTAWYGVFAPAGTPPAIVNRLSTEIAAVLKTPEVSRAMDNLGATPVGSSPKQFAEYVDAEVKRWGIAVKPLNINLD